MRPPPNPFLQGEEEKGLKWAVLSSLLLDGHRIPGLFQQGHSLLGRFLVVGEYSSSSEPSRP